MLFFGISFASFHHYSALSENRTLKEEGVLMTPSELLT